MPKYVSESQYPLPKGIIIVGHGDITVFHPYYQHATIIGNTALWKTKDYCHSFGKITLLETSILYETSKTSELHSLACIII